MNNSLQQVEEFHKTFGVPVLESPEIPDKKRILLRLILIFEELYELAQASGAEKDFVSLIREKAEQYIDNGESPDAVEAIDALCDLQVVLNGTILEYGFQNGFDQAFSEVHKSNMSKSCQTEEEGKLTMQKYSQEGIEVNLKEFNGRYLIYRASDNKVLKSINFIPPRLQQFVNQKSI